MTTDQLKADLKKSTPFYGVEVTLKKLRKGELRKIYLSTNCKDKETIHSLAKKTGIQVVELQENNAEIGVICKKPFSISALCFE